MPALQPRGQRRRHLPRARPRAAARRADERDHGRDVRQAGGLLARPRRLDAPVRRGDALLRRQRHRRRRPAAGRRAWRWPTSCSQREARHRLLLRRGRGRRGRVPRVAEPGRAVAAAGAVRLREQPVRDGHGAGALASRRPTCAPRRPAYGMPAAHVDGMDVLAVHEAARAGGRAGARRGRRRSSSSCTPTASARTRCSTPSCTATRPRSSTGRSTARSTPSPPG